MNNREALEQIIHQPTKVNAVARVVIGGAGLVGCALGAYHGSRGGAFIGSLPAIISLLWGIDDLRPAYSNGPLVYKHNKVQRSNVDPNLRIQPIDGEEDYSTIASFVFLNNFSFRKEALTLHHTDPLSINYTHKVNLHVEEPALRTFHFYTKSLQEAKDVKGPLYIIARKSDLAVAHRDYAILQ